MDGQPTPNCLKRKTNYFCILTKDKWFLRILKTDGYPEKLKKATKQKRGWITQRYCFLSFSFLRAWTCSLHNALNRCVKWRIMMRIEPHLHEVCGSFEIRLKTAVCPFPSDLLRVWAVWNLLGMDLETQLAAVKSGGQELFVILKQKATVNEISVPRLSSRKILPRFIIPVF